MLQVASNRGFKQVTPYRLQQISRLQCSRKWTKIRFTSKCGIIINATTAEWSGYKCCPMLSPYLTHNLTETDTLHVPHRNRK